MGSLIKRSYGNQYFFYVPYQDISFTLQNQGALILIIIFTLHHVFNFSEVLKACMSESGIKFADAEVDNLAQVLYQDAVKVNVDVVVLTIVFSCIQMIYNYSM